MGTIANSLSLYEINAELDDLLDQIQEEIETIGTVSDELQSQFQQFCDAHGEKVDRIGRFLRLMEAREQYCRAEAARLREALYR